MRTLACLAVAATLAAPAAASAGGISLGADAGVAIFTDAEQIGFGVELYPGYQIIDGLDLELNLGFQRASENNVSTAIIPIMPGARYSFDLGGAIKPFAHAHIGPVIAKVKLQEIDLGPLGSFGGSSSSTEFGMNLGGGVLFMLSDNVGVGGGVQWHHVFGDGGGLDIVDIGADFRFWL
jgi:opacity protein-like surface antigen